MLVCTHPFYYCFTLLVQAGSSGHVQTLDEDHILGLVIREAYQILHEPQRTLGSPSWDLLQPDTLLSDPDWTPKLQPI